MPGARVREEFARYAAPAAFLLGATIAVLLVRAGLNAGADEPAARRSTASVPTETAGATTAATTARTRTRPTTRLRRFYTLRTGDTLAQVAAMFDTTVERLLELNPTADPRSLRVGQRIRVA